MTQEHFYKIDLVWTGNTGEGTGTFTGYERAHEITVAGKPMIPGSSDPHFRGDKSRYNPEEMLVASLAGCHMLWYLHLCADAGIVVTDYTDAATGKMIETDSGGGRFIKVALNPHVVISRGSNVEKAQALHHRAHELCFIANSVNFPVYTKATVATENFSAAD